MENYKRSTKTLRDMAFWRMVDNKEVFKRMDRCKYLKERLKRNLLLPNEIFENALKSKIDNYKEKNA